MNDYYFTDCYSDFLFAHPSFIEGWARMLDFGNTLNEYNNAPNGNIADNVATYLDWVAVGSYIRNAMVEYGEETQKESTFTLK